MCRAVARWSSMVSTDCWRRWETARRWRRPWPACRTIRRSHASWATRRGARRDRNSMSASWSSAHWRSTRSFAPCRKHLPNHPSRRPYANARPARSCAVHGPNICRSRLDRWSNHNHPHHENRATGGHIMPSPLKQANVLDYIPASEHAALRAGHSTYDCTGDIQAAIAAADKAFVPAGIYLVKQLNLKSGFELYGEGPSSQLKAYDASLASEFMLVTHIRDGGTRRVADNMRDIHLHDLKLDGRVAEF